jgi:hypothetical protein
VVGFDALTLNHARVPDLDDEVSNHGNIFVDGKTRTNSALLPQSTNVKGDSDDEDATDEDEDTEDE